MIFAIIGLIIVMALMYVAIVKYLPVPVSVPQATVRTSYSQLDVFRDMEPNSQVRENQWVGFLQEDVRKSSGSLGDFEGNDASSVRVYAF
jgi:hypothetical protein